MNPLRLACVLAIAGGGCWVVRFLLTLGSGDDPSSALFWAGAVLLTVMGAVFSVVAVRRAPLWLRLIVFVCGPVAGWMVLLAAYDPADSAGLEREALHGIVGALCLLTGGLRWGAGRAESRHRGSHSR